MAMEAALFYTDAQGITGDNSIESRKDSSEILELHQSLTKPMDAQTGTARGVRTLGPVRVLKRMDKASPQLVDAWAKNKSLGKLEIKWYRPNKETGLTEHFYTLILERCSIGSVDVWLPNTMAAESASYSPSEWISIHYALCTWQFEDGAIMAMDSWTDQGSGA